MALSFFQFAYNDDNYGVLAHDNESGETASIDAGDADAVLAALAETGWSLSHLWVTHHHWDHVDGLTAVKAKTGCKVIGPVAVGKAIAGIDVHVQEGDRIVLGAHTVEVLQTPGHTLDMINYYLPGAGVVFTGDTLFAMGCGRLFEGTPDQMWQSLLKLRALPETTTVYCAHEYTLANAAFALSIDPENQALKKRAEKVKAQRALGEPTVPTDMTSELATNPFLRADDGAVRANLGMQSATDAEVFAEIRKRKDNF